MVINELEIKIGAQMLFEYSNQATLLVYVTIKYHDTVAISV
jgi:hypothetical protein